jgi:hypothetical protein
MGTMAHKVKKHPTVKVLKKATQKIFDKQFLAHAHKSIDDYGDMKNYIIREINKFFQIQYGDMTGIINGDLVVDMQNLLNDYDSEAQTDEII